MELASTLKTSQTAAKPSAASFRSGSGPAIAPDSLSTSKNTAPDSGVEQETRRNGNLEQELQKALASLGLPTDAFRMELSYSQDTGRVVARVLDKDNGNVLREIPSKELQRLFSQMRDFVGAVVDRKA